MEPNPFYFLLHVFTCSLPYITHDGGEWGTISATKV